MPDSAQAQKQCDKRRRKRTKPGPAFHSLILGSPGLATWQDGWVLILAGTPIGRFEDASPRLAKALIAADVIAAEDTRRFRRLATDLGLTITAKVVSYFEGNEAQRTNELLNYLRSGQTVVLVTDAGMPSVSDPGYRLVAAAVAEDIALTAIPGPSAVLTALAISGLPVERFTFEGFLSRKAGQRAAQLNDLSAEPRTMVFFEAPHRTAETLQAMVVAFGGDRPGAICRELTKTYEEVIRGPLAELLDWARSNEVLGEITLVVAGAKQESVTPEKIRELIDGHIAAGMTSKEAINQVVSQTGARKNFVYEIAHQSPSQKP